MTIVKWTINTGEQQDLLYFSLLLTKFGSTFLLIIATLAQHNTQNFLKKKH